LDVVVAGLEVGARTPFRAARRGSGVPVLPCSCSSRSSRTADTGSAVPNSCANRLTRNSSTSQRSSPARPPSFFYGRHKRHQLGRARRRILRRVTLGAPRPGPTGPSGSAAGARSARTAWCGESRAAAAPPGSSVWPGVALLRGLQREPEREDLLQPVAELRHQAAQVLLGRGQRAPRKTALVRR